MSRKILDYKSLFCSISSLHTLPQAPCYADISRNFKAFVKTRRLALAQHCDALEYEVTGTDLASLVFFLFSDPLQDPILHAFGHFFC